MKENEVYMLVALRRSKDEENAKRKALCRRHVVSGNVEEAVEQLMDRCHESGLWRLYRTVNKRDLTKGLKQLQVELVLNGEDFKDNVAGKWKSLLMKPNCRAEKKWLVDLDSKDEELYEKVLKSLKAYTTVCEECETPNGRHLVVMPFDRREFDKTFEYDPVELKKDCLVFVRAFKR